MTKFDKLKRFILSRRTFRFSDVNRFFELPASSLNSYTTYLNYLVSTGYVNKTDGGTYSAADRERLRNANVGDIKVRLANSKLKRDLKDLGAKHILALEEEWNLHSKLTMQEDHNRSLNKEIGMMIHGAKGLRAEIEVLKTDNKNAMIAFFVSSTVAALSLVGLVIAVFS